jgi:MoaA/NifB/PqqE/SkfB family radical SAM enzyme
MGKETALRFRLVQEEDLILRLHFVNTFPDQTISIEINGRIVETLHDLREGTRIERQYPFRSQPENEITLRYNKTSGSLGFYPGDSRDLAAIFYEFKVVHGDTDEREKRYPSRYDLASISYLGSPLQNAELNRREYEEGRVILKSLPSVVTMALTTYCNNQAPCLICDRHTRTPEADCAINDQVIQNATPLLKTAMYVLLHCGGEAMFSRHYDQVIESIEPPTRVTFATNAMLMTKKRTDLMLAKDIMAGIVVSLDAATPEIYRIMRPGSRFETVVENVAYYISKVKELGREHSNVTLNMTLCETNLCDVPKLVDLAARIGAYGVDYNHLNVGQTHTVKTVDGWDWNYLEQADFKDKDRHDRLLLEAYNNAKEKGIHISLVGKPFLGPNKSKYQKIIDDMTHSVAFQESQKDGHWYSPLHKSLGPSLTPCFKPWQETVIQPNGVVRLCYFHDEGVKFVGDLSKSDFMSIWNSDPMIVLREQFLSHGVARWCVESQPCLHRGRQ